MVDAVLVVVVVAWLVVNKCGGWLVSVMVAAFSCCSCWCCWFFFGCFCSAE